MIQDNRLYRRSLDELFLRFLSMEEATQAMAKIHVGVCGAHQCGPKLQNQLKRLGYYWPTTATDCIEYAKRCHVCQLLSDYGHLPVEPLYDTSCS